MRPFVLVSGDFATTGGMDRANHALALHLARTGREVHVVAHHADAELSGTRGVTVHRVPRPLGSHVLGSPLLARRGRAVARSVPGARVIVNGGNCATRSASWVHYVHAAWKDDGAGAWRALVTARDRAREARIVPRARPVVVNSQRTRDDVVALGVPAGAVHVVYYGGDAGTFRPPTPEERSAAQERLALPGPVFAFVGALGDRRKGFDVVLAAWSRLGPAAPSLFVVGEGAARSAWEQRVREAGLGGRIVFGGFRSDVRDVLWACDALVAPSRYEAYGLAAHEAIACGRPAVVPRAAGIAERYAPGMEPLLLDRADDAEALARAVRLCTAPPDELRAAVNDCGGALAAWTWDDMSARIAHLVEDHD